jgi:hypothetical protein
VNLTSKSRNTFVFAAPLVTIFLSQMVFAIRHEGMTYDEGFHTDAGVWYWQCSDFGVNPEHPPFAKLVAAFPLRFGSAPSPSGNCPVAVPSKGAGYSDSTRWLFGDGQRGQGALDVVLPKARHAMMLFRPRKEHTHCKHRSV